MMETIKVSVDINVSLSEATQSFLRGLFNSSLYQAAAPEKKQVESTPATPISDKTEEAKTASLVPTTKPAAIPTTEPGAESNGPVHSIGELRKELAAKVNTHRGAIKAKLDAFNAKSLTVLAEDKYDEMYNFLVSL